MEKIKRSKFIHLTLSRIQVEFEDMSYTYIICFPVKEHLAVTVSKNYPMVGNMFFEVVYPLRKIMEFILKRYLPNFSIRRANSKDLSKISGVYSKVLGLK